MELLLELVRINLIIRYFRSLGTIPIIHENMILPKTDMFVTLRNNGPSEEEKDKHWSMMVHGDGSMHARIGHDATSGDLDEIPREHTSYFRP